MRKHGHRTAGRRTPPHCKDTVRTPLALLPVRNTDPTPRRPKCSVWLRIGRRRSRRRTSRCRRSAAPQTSGLRSSLCASSVCFNRSICPSTDHVTPSVATLLPRLKLCYAFVLRSGLFLLGLVVTRCLLFPGILVAYVALVRLCDL